MLSEVTEKSLIKSIGDNKNKGRRFAFLLGAGASITSGITGAGKLAEKWLNEIAENDPTRHQEITEADSFNKDNVAASYTRIYQARFQDFPDDGYREIEELMSDDKVQPSFGYTVLAQVLTDTRHNVVLTTNFDRLAETALLIYTNTHARVIAHEEMLNVIAIHDQKPSIVKIHRDMQFSPMSDIKDVEQLDSKWNDIIRALLNQYSIVCLGYGGNDNGLMSILKQELKSVPQGKIYWCYRGETSPETQQLAKEFGSQLKLVKTAGFDEFMLGLNQALGFKTLSQQIKAISEKRQSLYDQQLKKLTESTTDNGNLEAVKELITETWWAVQVEVNKEKNIETQDQIYQKGLEKFPQSPELTGNYALFLKNIRKDYDKAETYYQEALALDSEDADFNGNYAIFLEDIRKDYDKAETYYQKALALDSEDADFNGNYAILLEKIRKDYDKAETYYQKALALDPESADFNGNYASFLLQQGNEETASHYLKKAEQLANEPAIQLELAFYRIALFPDSYTENKAIITKLLTVGHTSPGWDFSGIITQAEKQGSKNLTELNELAEKISAI